MKGSIRVCKRPSLAFTLSRTYLLANTNNLNNGFILQRNYAQKKPISFDDDEPLQGGESSRIDYEPIEPTYDEQDDTYGKPTMNDDGLRKPWMRNPNSAVAEEPGDFEQVLQKRSSWYPRKPKKYEKEEMKFDWIPLKESVYPRKPVEQTDYRSYVPEDQGDEEPGEPYYDLPDSNKLKGYGEEPVKHLPVIQPKLRKTKIDSKGRTFGYGGRKRAVAQAFITTGTGKITVNGRHFLNYFPQILHREKVVQPFAVTERVGEWDVDVRVHGGGLSGQAEAIRLALSKALQTRDVGFRLVLKQAGFLRRDKRKVEMKKSGQPKARKRKQWSKR